MTKHLYSSPLGEIIISSDGENITALYFSDMLREDSAHAEPQSLPVFEQAREWLNIYFSGKKPGFIPPLRIEGSEFYRSICEIILTIDFGHVMTYSEIARMNAEHRKIPGMSPQAVGRAAANNKILIMIPCHRVIGSNGSLTGYSGGISRKLKLLELEGVDISHLSKNEYTKEAKSIWE